MSAPFVVGIGGGSGSGKTRVAELLCRRYGTSDFALLSQDSYYVDRKDLAGAERASLNYDHPSCPGRDTTTLFPLGAVRFRSWVNFFPLRSVFRCWVRRVGLRDPGLLVRCRAFTCPVLMVGVLTR